MGFHLFRERTRVPTKTGDSFLHTRYAWPPNEKLVQCDVEKCFDKKDHFLLLSFLNESFGKENKETFYRPSYMFHLTGKKIKTKGFTRKWKVGKENQAGRVWEHPSDLLQVRQIWTLKRGVCDEQTASSKGAGFRQYLREDRPVIKIKTATRLSLASNPLFFNGMGMALLLETFRVRYLLSKAAPDLRMWKIVLARTRILSSFLARRSKGAQR